MMEDKNNQQPLEEEKPVCPETAETVTEETVEQAAPVEETAPVQEKPAQMKKGILLTPGKLVGLICGVVVLVAVLVGAIVYGMGGFVEEQPEETEPSAEATETLIATTPADTGLDDVTNKGTYTVSDEEILELADTVVATMGDKVLTNRELQIHYWMQVQNFMSNYYYYLSYFDLDYTQPLDTQICNILGNGYTWQQYFLEAALYNWQNYQAMANMARDNGLEISEEDRAYLDSLADNLTASAQEQGYEDAQGLIEFNVGKGGDLESYIQYEEQYIQGYQYYEQQASAIVLTEEEVEAYFTENEDYYAESGITRDGIYVDVRHILIVPEGKNPGDTYTDEEWASCLTSAQAVLDEWLNGEATEESFAALANQYSVDSDGTDGGLYEGVYEGQMVTNFNDWCFDESRQYGDYDLVQTEYGYHIMFFVGSEPMWKTYAEDDLMAERANQIVEDACEIYPMEIDYSAIALGLVDIATWFGE